MSRPLSTGGTSTITTATTDATSEMSGRLDDHWANTELIPFLAQVFGPSEPKTGRAWIEVARDMFHYIGYVPIWEDFDSSIERIRLLLVNPAILTQAERKEIEWVAKHSQLCVVVFVRHQVRHGTYTLFSLGQMPDPDHPRPALTTLKEKTEYVYGGRFAANRRDAESSPRNWKIQARRREERKARRAEEKAQGKLRVYNKDWRSGRGYMTSIVQQKGGHFALATRDPALSTHIPPNGHPHKEVHASSIGDSCGKARKENSGIRLDHGNLGANRKDCGLRGVLTAGSSNTSPTPSVDGSTSTITTGHNNENLSLSTPPRQDRRERGSPSLLLSKKSSQYLRAAATSFTPSKSAHQL